MCVCVQHFRVDIPLSIGLDTTEDHLFGLLGPVLHDVSADHLPRSPSPLLFDKQDGLHNGGACLTASVTSVVFTLPQEGLVSLSQVGGDSHVLL